MVREICKSLDGEQSVTDLDQLVGLLVNPAVTDSNYFGWEKPITVRLDGLTACFVLAMVDKSGKSQNEILRLLIGLAVGEVVDAMPEADREHLQILYRQHQDRELGKLEARLS